MCAILRPMARLFLLDGTALAYRSHFAFEKSRLSATDGRPTGATFGFTQAVLRIIEAESPDLFAGVLDFVVYGVYSTHQEGLGRFEPLELDASQAVAQELEATLAQTELLDYLRGDANGLEIR